MRKLVFIVGLILVGCGSSDPKEGWTEARISSAADSCRSQISNMRLSSNSMTESCKCYSEDLSTSYTYEEYTDITDDSDKRGEIISKLTSCIADNVNTK